MSSKRLKSCKNCSIKEDLRLLNDFFPVPEDFEKDNYNIKRVYINEFGLCQYCDLYNKNYDYTLISDEVASFINSDFENMHKEKTLVAVSGGKDSLAALYIAKVLLKMDPIAVTYDNGFIPNTIIEQTKRICSELDVEYKIIKKDLYNKFNEEYYKTSYGIWEAKTGIDFCKICSKQIGLVIQEVCKSTGIHKVIYGNKIYTQLEPKVSCLKYYYYLDENKIIHDIVTINLLFALKINDENQKIILDLIHWKDPKMPGYTSNCFIPGFVEYPRFLKGLKNDSGYLEMELRSGSYKKNDIKKIESNKIKDLSNEIDLFFFNIVNP